MVAPGYIKMKKGIRYCATDMEMEKVSEMIDATFSEKEVKEIADTGTTYFVRPAVYRGYYLWPKNAIVIDRPDGLVHELVAHETAHMLRRRDKNRKSVLLKTNNMMNIEESCTIAEQMARSRKKDLSGYYYRIPVFDKEKRRWRNPTDSEAERMCREDYLLFTYGRGKPLKGNDALESVERNWADSHISRLRYKSRRMAISDLARQDSSFRDKEEKAISKARNHTGPKKTGEKKTYVPADDIALRNEKRKKK